MVSDNGKVLNIYFIEEGVYTSGDKAIVSFRGGLFGVQSTQRRAKNR